MADELSEDATRAVEHAAEAYGADAARLLDSQRFHDAASQLDETADDYADHVSELVGSTVDADRRFAAAPEQSSGGAELNGGGERYTPPSSMREAIARAYGN